MGACSSNEKNNEIQLEKMYNQKIKICSDCKYEFSPMMLSNQTTKSDISTPLQLTQSQKQEHFSKHNSSSFSSTKSNSKKQIKGELQMLKRKITLAKEQHYLQIHQCIYDNSQNLFYCKHISSCSFAHKSYKEVEKHVMENHMDNLEKKHHKKFVTGIQKGHIGLNRNGTQSYFCTECKIMYDNKIQHDLVCSKSNNSECCIDQSCIQESSITKKQNNNNNKNTDNNNNGGNDEEEYFDNPIEN